MVSRETFLARAVVLAAGGIVEGARIRQSAFGSEGKA
jgi:hypothetical protein